MKRTNRSLERSAVFPQFHPILFLQGDGASNPALTCSSNGTSLRKKRVKLVGDKLRTVGRVKNLHLHACCTIAE